MPNDQMSALLQRTKVRIGIYRINLADLSKYEKKLT